MNKDWSDKNKDFQKLISKEKTFKDGIKTLLELRKSLFDQVTQIVNNYPVEAFFKMPYPNAKGYHCKTLAYSIWHIFRIEDICAHELVCGDKQILFRDNWQKKINSSIITTGNELQGQQIVDFSKKLDVKFLFEYAKTVMESTNEILKSLDFSDTKKSFGADDRFRVVESKSVSDDENAVWLIDYWCGKNLAGLLKMPFSRHWIMHIEAMQRIKNRLCELERKGVNPVAYCGFSCNHCFLSQWCGSCRTDYNVCSFATCSPDKICPNVKCCKEKKLDGCYDCDEIRNCTKGFYAKENDGANAAKAQALFIKKYGQKEFLKLHDQLHKKYDFAKTQEILSPDLDEGLKFLENNKIGHI